MSFGDLYSRYYDLLYKEKNYCDEANYVLDLLSVHTSEFAEILNLGCGTCKHDEFFCMKGYKVYGVDVSSKMIDVAKKSKFYKQGLLTLECANIADFHLNKKFDVAVSLFHVVSYLTTNSILIQSLRNIYDHLDNGGLFVFDFWYGPAVLTDPPVVRVKRLSDDQINVVRLSEPIIYPEYNTVDVNFEIMIENQSETDFERKSEVHKMRYFFDPELELILNDIGFEIINKYKWLTDESPGFGSWNVVWVVKK